jgi:hypothetical protein
MKVRRGFAIFLAGFLLTALSTWAGVTTDYDRDVKFSHYRIYSWGKVKTTDGIWDERVKSAVDSQLAAKGWTEVESGGDVVVTARGTIQDQQELDTFYEGFGGWRRFGGLGDATTTVETFKVGTLIVEMFDGQSKKLIWRATATNTLSDEPDKNIKPLDNNVKKMFQHFPPEAKE